MPTKRDEYLRTIDELNNAISKAEAYAAAIKAAAAKLGTWQHAWISNIGAVGGYPPEVTAIYATQEIDGQTWPTAQELDNTLRSYHRAASHLKNLWGSMSAAEKAALPPPEKYIR